MNIWRAMFTRQWIFTTLLVLVGTSVCVRLGIWQLDRLSQRRAFNAHYLEATKISPLILDATPIGDLTDMEYRLVTVNGKYDVANNIVLRNQYHNGQPGYFLLTPLMLSNDAAILIERGWIPSEGNSSPEDWHKYDLSAPVAINGIIRLGQIQPEVGGIPDPELSAGQKRLDFWNLINLDRISRQVTYKLLPVFIQPNPDPMPTSPPYPYQPVIEISEGPHLGYALQWFSFASILFIGYPFFLRKQLTSYHSNAESPENI
jgi:surfeit locus 1 family protein